MEYKNGNYVVRILKDGTKERLSDNPIPEYPESIDVKVTNKCDGGCKFCHENSTIDGKSFDPKFAINLLSGLPNGTELAIGGGNPLEVLQDINYLKRKLYGKIINITVNAKHLPKTLHFNAIGISYNKGLHEKIKQFYNENKDTQVVIHLIAGVHSIDDLKNCLNDFDRVLILGYKQVGRGKLFFNESVENCLKEWEKEIGIFLYGQKGKYVVFDNLAISQLNIERFFTKEKWSNLYMGGDGEFTMYLDLVERKYAVSSRSDKKFDIGEKSIKEIFNHIRSIR